MKITILGIGVLGTFLLTFVFLCQLNFTQVQRKQGPQSEDQLQTPTLQQDQQLWKQSTAWQEYIEKSDFMRYSVKIKRQGDYCKLRDDYLSKSTARTEPKIYTDFADPAFARQILDRHGDIVLSNQYDNTYEILTFPPSIDLFWTKSPNTHEWYQIDRNFLWAQQRYNHIPGSQLLTYKDLLIISAQEYEKQFVGRESCFSTWDFLPKTYIMEKFEDCVEINRIVMAEPIDSINWMVKISRNVHNAQGVRLFDSEMKHLLLVEWQFGDKCFEMSHQNDKPTIVQKLIKNPALVQGRKFDFRVWMIVASTDPFMVLFYDAIVKISPTKFDPENFNLQAVLTNTSAKSEDMEMDEVKWTPQELEEYYVKENLAEQGWLNDIIRPKLKQHVIHLARQLQSSKNILKHPGAFELFGLDFILDTDNKVWLIEVIPSPGLNAFTPSIEAGVTQVLDDLMEMELALARGEWDRFDEIANSSPMEWIYDERKEGMERYHGLLNKDCI